MPSCTCDSGYASTSPAGRAARSAADEQGEGRDGLEGRRSPAPASLAGEVRGQGGDRAVQEDVPDGHPEAGRRAAHRPGRPRGCECTAEVEEAVVDADLLQVRAPDPRSPPTALLQLGRRRRTCTRSTGTAASDRAARSTLPLAFNGNASTATNSAGTMYSGSCSAHAPGSDPAHQSPRRPAGRTPPAGRRRRRPTRHQSDRVAPHRRRPQHRLDLTQLDPITPDLHLVVDPTEELHRPVRQTAHQIPGPIQPRPRRQPNGSGTNRSAVNPA